MEKEVKESQKPVLLNQIQEMHVRPNIFEEPQSETSEKLQPPDMEREPLKIYPFEEAIKA